MSPELREALQKTADALAADIQQCRTRDEHMRLTCRWLELQAILTAAGLQAA